MGPTTQITVTTVVARELSLTASVAEVAEILGVTVDEMIGIVENANYIPDTAAEARLIAASDVDNEDVTIDEMYEA